MLLIVSFLLICAISWAIARCMHQGIPVAASCSLVISAACTPKQEEVDLQLKKVKWGVVGPTYNDRAGHCSFSANTVEMPESGNTYR
ncbi:hypothetical protein HBI61_134790 [Parastagonospora nodorum]|nr:hypothetical protein HBH95_081160 [Parastagonospora nodorum]KAH6175672.1 hypothetical protein HBI61_134790 [Parastagonospora nodorum]